MNNRTLATLLAATTLFAVASPAADQPLAKRFDWMSGHWCGKQGNSQIEEFWMPSQGDLALGIGRTLKGGVTVEHEFLRIETRDGETRLVALHNDQPPTPFRLTA